MMNGHKEAGQFVKKETMLTFCLLCLVIGFLGGIVFSVYKSPGQAPSSGTPTVQPQQSQGISPDMAKQFLELEREVAANPKNVEAWTQLGHLYFDTNQIKKAINAYNKSLELNPDDPDVLTDLGVMYRRDGDPAQAVATFDRAIAVNPLHETSRFNKAIVLLYDMKDKEGAIKAWEELIKANPMAAAPNGKLVSEIVEELKQSDGGN